MLNRPANGTDIGEVVASSREYEGAQQIVSKLIAGEVPARDIVIVGEGVRTVERVTGRLGYAAAARSGAINGVLIGLFLSAWMLFGTPDAPVSLFLGFVFIGVALGMIMSLVTYAIVRRRRDFASITQMVADHYEVRVQPRSLAKARQVLGPQRVETPKPPVDLSEPPKYGERITPGGGQGAATGAAAGGTPHQPHVVPPPQPAPPAPERAGSPVPGEVPEGEVGGVQVGDASAPGGDVPGQGGPGGDVPGGEPGGSSGGEPSTGR